MIHVPELIKRGEHLRAYLRGDESSLPANIRELGMLVTAREMDCQFIWNAHAAQGRRSGLSDALVDGLRDKKELSALSPSESAVIDYGREFFRTHRVSETTFNEAMSQFGTRGLVELTTMMGYYSCLAFNINAFEVGLPEGIAELPLPV
jgi:4-carboxymuconolactone decarboxylase